jgi:uncharacterized protein YlxW (UPF0749 family)
MNIITAWLVCGALFLILISVVYVTIKNRKAQNNEIKRLTAELETQKKMCGELTHYVKEIAKVNDDKESVSQKIKEAENDEEVLSIIAGLVSANNNRVRK